MQYIDGFTKLKYRLNKSGTQDFENIDKDAASEVINKAFNDWFRRTYHGNNILKEGNEESRIRIDDLQPLLSSRKLTMTDRGVYSESNNLPRDYRYFNRVYFLHKDDCGEIIIPSQLAEDSNVDVLLNTDGTKPSLDFEQVFHTISSNKIKVYHNKEFLPKEVTLSYYKNPKKYDSNKPYEYFELKDDVMELIIDEAAKIIAGDMDNNNQYQRNSTSVENNN